MFKLAKYYFLFNWYQKTKRNMIAIMVFFVLFLVSIYMFDDLIAMADDKFELVIIKWIVILIFLSAIVCNMVKLLKVVPVPFKKEESDVVADKRKEKIIAKERLLSRSDLIINKYRDNV